jgi:hypothetical protein
MSTGWCADYTAHADKTKFGRKPSYPIGKRQIDYNLATFLTYTSSIPFNENDNLCKVQATQTLSKIVFLPFLHHLIERELLITQIHFLT